MPDPHTVVSASIRAMTPEDREAVIDILTHSDPWKTLGYTATSWNEVFAPLPLGRDSFVVEWGGRVVAIAILRQKFLFGDYLELLAVAPSIKGQGIGSQLLAHLESLVYQRAKNLFACVSDFNTAARRFYERHGFQEVGPMRDFLVKGAAEILLRKSVGPVNNTHSFPG